MNKKNIELIGACWSGNGEKVKKLLTPFLFFKSVDVNNIKDSCGNTPLILASIKGFQEIAHFLIVKGANVNAKNKNGETPLIRALDRGFKEMVELLIANGADVNAKNNAGETSFNIASDKGFKEIAELLISKGADVSVMSNKKVAPSNELCSDSSFSLGEKLSKAYDFLNSGELKQEIERAKMARDQASAEEWKRQGSPGLGKPHSCNMCRKAIYGEEAVVQKQANALQSFNHIEAQRIEQSSGYRCRKCGKEFCKDCLEKKAPGNAYGGKSCPSCKGLFEIIHG